MKTRRVSASLYERLGGEAAVMAACQAFYSRLSDDPLLAPFFEGMDLAALTAKQVGFLSRAFDGPEEFHGRPLRQAHARLVRDHGLTDLHFDRVARHLSEVLVGLSVPLDLVAEVAEIVERTRPLVLGRT